MPNPDLILSTPAIWVPGIDAEQWADELSNMIDRAFATRDLLNGTLPPDAFLDLIDSHSIDVFELCDDWDEPWLYL